jgi:hypothetical protein
MPYRPNSGNEVILTVRCNLLPRIVRRSDFLNDGAAAAATVILENGAFRLDQGFKLTCRGPVHVEFPNLNTLRLVSTGSHYQPYKGEIALSGNEIEIDKLKVEVNDEAVALVGEISHTANTGSLLVSKSGDTTGELLDPSSERRPLALRV